MEPLNMAMQIDYRESAAAPSGLPRNPSIPAIHRNTATGFFYEWNTHSQSWLAKPKVYRALLTQSDTDAPVATVLENTLGGTPVWNYEDPGTYNSTLTGAFPVGKTFLSLSGNNPTPFDAVGFYILYRSSDNAIQLLTRDGSQALNNGILNGASIEVLVYP